MQSSESSREQVFFCFLLVVVAAISSGYKIPSGDHWTHIAQGLYILDTGTIPREDVHSFTYAGAPWVNWEWLHNVMQAFFWRLSEEFGVILFRFLQIAALLVLFFGYLVRRTHRPFLSFFATIALLLLTLPRLNDRPHVFAYGCMAGVLFVSTYWDTAKNKKAWVAWGALLFIMLGWRNVHPSWPLGLLLITVLLLDWYRQEKRGGETLLPLKKRVLALAALVLVTVICSPFPLDFRHYVSLQQEGAMLPEWRPLFLLGRDLFRVYFLSFFVFAGGIIFCVWHQRAQRPFYLFVALGMLVEAFWHNRFIPDAVLLGLPVIVESVPPISWRSPVRPVLVGILLGAAATLLSRNYLISYYDLRWGWGIDEVHNPIHAARFLKEHRAGGNLFAAYWNTSDFLLCYLYPHIKVAVDMRVPGLYPFDFANRLWYINNEQDFRRFVLTLPLDYLVLGRPDAVAFQKHDEGMEEILARDGYELVYFDRRYAVYRTSQGRLRPEAAAMPAYRVLRRWRNDPTLLAEAAHERFDDILFDLELLKQHTAGRDNAYRAVIRSLYGQPFLSDEQRSRLEKLYDSPPGDLGS